MKLTDEQRDFALTQGENILTLAAAGSGKTATLVKFIEDKIVSEKVKASEIVSFSFTRKAASELTQRIEKNFKNKNVTFPYISTMHSFCWNDIIKDFYALIGFTAVPGIVHEFPEEFIDLEYKRQKSKKERGAFIKDLADIIRKDLQKETFEREETARLLQFLVLNNLTMFDFMTPMANYLLEDATDEMRDKFKNFRYIIVDEAQDTNPAQYKLVKNLAALFGKTNVIMVGDFKQGIYGFRGSDPTILKNFVVDFNPSLKILSYNFRSAPEIVEFANKIAKGIDLGNEEMNRSQISNTFHSDLEGDVFRISDVEDFLEELKLVDHPLHQTCILARTNQTVKSLAKILGLLGLPYYLHTEYDILKRAEVKIFMNFLNIVSNGYNKALVIEIIKGIKGSVPLKITQGIARVQNINELRMYKDITKIPEIIDIYNQLNQGDFKQAMLTLSKALETKQKTAESIMLSLEKFYRDLKEVKANGNLDSWMDALEELLFEAQFLNQKSENKIQLMTIHKSKGLEWDNVILLYDFSLLEKIEDNFYDVDEEKRVVYTAVTRPRLSLAIWDLDNSTHSELFYQMKLERLIKQSIQRGVLDLDDFSKWNKK